MDEFEVIKTQMEARRSALAEKLEALEQQVSESVQEVTSAVSTVTEVVQDTVETVKETVQETVDSVRGSVQDSVDAVKETFDLPYQVDNHPWAMVAGAFGVGLLTGWMLPSRDTRTSPAMSTGIPMNGNTYPAQTAYVPPAPPKPTWMQSLGSLLAPEIDKLKGLAIATGLGMVRDSITQAVPPEVGAQLGEVIDNLTTKLGGKPVHDLAGNGASNGSNYHFANR